jgi:hypothetical protein
VRFLWWRPRGLHPGLQASGGAFYGCAFYHKRGRTVCKNSLLIAQDRLDAVVLQSLAEALDERILERAAQKALQTAKEGQEPPLQQRMALEKELAQAEEQIAHLVTAVKRGKATDVLLESLEAEQARKQVLQLQLAGLTVKPVAADTGRIMQDLRKRLVDVRGLLGRHVPQTRQILRKLIVGRLTCEAFDDGERRGYRFTGQASYAALLPGKLATTNVVTPAGFEPAISTLKGLRPGPG